MSEPSTHAEVDIHLRARLQDRALIDQAAELVDANRSQFMPASTLKEAKNILLDRSTLVLDAETFHAVIDALDRPEEEAGLGKLLQNGAPWGRG